MKNDVAIYVILSVVFHTERKLLNGLFVNRSR